MLARAAALLEANLDRITQEWEASRSRVGVVGPSAWDVSSAFRGFLVSLAQALREQRTTVTPELEEQAKQQGQRYQEQGYDLRILVAEYALLREMLWQLFRHNLRAGDLAVVDLAAYLENVIDGVLLRAVEAYAEAHAEVLTQRAALDALTRVYTRGYLMERLSEEVERAKRYQRPFSILMVDVDGLKTINDAFGHQAGDEALRRVAGLLSSSSRKADSVGRYGGDEFIVVLAETPAQGALIQANRLVRQVAEARIPMPRDTKYLSVSIGMATYPEGGTAAESLIATADQALYQAKARGGNAVAQRHPDGTLEVVHVPLPAEGEVPTAFTRAPEKAAVAQPTALLAGLQGLEQVLAEMRQAIDRFQGRLKEAIVAPVRSTDTTSRAEAPVAKEEMRPLAPTAEDERRRMRARLEDLHSQTEELQRRLAVTDSLMRRLEEHASRGRPGDPEPQQPSPLLQVVEQELQRLLSSVDDLGGQVASLQRELETAASGLRSP